jgi:ABC-type antimicrobial peptide transport system permease subunit
VNVALSYAAARFRSRHRRVLVAAAGIAAASAMVGAAVTVWWSFSTGFDRAAARADLPDAIASFDPLPRSAIASRAEALPNLRAVGYRLVASGRHLWFGSHGSDHTTVIGVEGRPRGYGLVSGHDFSAGDDVVVEAGLARTWHLHVGDELELDGQPLHVTGVAVAPDTVAFPLAKGPRLWLPYQTVRALDGAPPDVVNQALIWVRDPRKLDVTLSQARMASYGVTGLQFVTRRGVRALIGQAGGIVIALLGAFSLVALATAGAMLGAAAAADVQRRLPSIGLLRAVGASKRGIALTFAVEGALIAAPAATVGIFVGWLVAGGPTERLLSSLNELPPGSSLLGLLTAALAAIVLIVAAASALPAWRACRHSPVEALRGADVVVVKRTARVSPGPAGLGLRLALARPLRTGAVAVVLALSASVVLLILAIASLLARLHATPAAVGKRYELAVSAPASAAGRIARLPGVAGATPRWSVDAADSFDLGEPFTLVAYGADHTLWEAPPLAEGRRIRGPREVEVGLGLAQALDLHPGAMLAAQLAGGAEVRFRVVGIDRVLQDQGLVAYVQPERLLRTIPWSDASVAVKLKPGATGSAVEAALSGAGYYATSSGGVSGEAVQGWAGRNGGFVSILVALLRAIALLDGAVCVYVLVQMLALTAQERRQALGVVRAVGASRGQLALIFAASALAVTALAAPASVVLERHVIAPLVTRLTASYVSVPVIAGGAPIAIVVSAMLLAAVAAAFMVARSASREAVVTALREE